MFDVITIGSATQDAFMVSKKFKIINSNLFTTGKGECVSFGSKIELDQFVLTTGGGATNTSATFSSLGFKTSIITRIGNDIPGQSVLEDLKNFKVNTELVKTIKGGQTGYGALLTAMNGERSVLVNRGVSGDFTEKDIPFSKLKTKWLYISSLAGNTTLVAKIAENARKKGIKVAYNPGSAELKKGVKAFASIINNIDLLSMNLEEAQMLAKLQTRDVKKLVEKIAHPGLTLLLTDGSAGSYAHKDNELIFARTRNVKVISRTGAGDGFGSGVVASLMKGLSLEDALRVGTINAESIIQSLGAKFGIITKWPDEKIMKQVKISKL